MMKDLDFAADKDLAKDFLVNFADADGEPKYMKNLQEVANHKLRAVQIDLEDLFNYKDSDEDFLKRVVENTKRYLGVFANAIDELLPVNNVRNRHLIKHFTSITHISKI